MARKQSPECAVEGCSKVPLSRDMCRTHYSKAQGITSKSSSPKANAEAALRQGGSLTPPRSLPYRALARSCPKCGALMTTPDHLLRRSAGPIPKCHPCHIAAVSQVRRKRIVVDDKFRKKERRRATRNRSRTNAKTLERATRTGVQWTGPELEVIARPDLTARQAAYLLGRTLYAVKHARRKIHEPKWAKVAGLSLIVP